MKRLVMIIFALMLMLGACSHQQSNVAKSEFDTDANFDWAAYGVVEPVGPEAIVKKEKSGKK